MLQIRMALRKGLRIEDLGRIGQTFALSLVPTNKRSNSPRLATNRPIKQWQSRIPKVYDIAIMLHFVWR